MSAMDELSAFFDDLSPVKAPRRGRPPKRQLSSVKARRRVRPPKRQLFPTPVLSMTNKQFDSQYFNNSVVNQIERKYKNDTKDDAIIDMNDMQIVGDIGSFERRNATKIGYFADNTLEELRQKSFRDKRSISSAVKSTSNANKHIKQVMSSDKPLAQKTANQLLKQKPKAKQLIESKMQLIPISEQLITDIKQMVTNIETAEESDAETIVDSEWEELEKSYTLFGCETRNVWFDSTYQLDLLNNTIEFIKRFKWYKEKLYNCAINALQASITNGLSLNLSGLPNGPNLIPIIKFDSENEPNFEFFISSSQSPDPQEVLHLDQQIIHLSKVIYECIQQ